VRLEGEIGVALPDRVIEYVRTYGDLVRATLAARRWEPAYAASSLGVPVWARLVSARGETVRAAFLTPYVAETIADNALHAERGARLEVLVPATASEDELQCVRSRFAWLRDHGVSLTVARQEQPRSQAA